jgi:hypothetical protein
MHAVGCKLEEGIELVEGTLLTLGLDDSLGDELELGLD